MTPKKFFTMLNCAIEFRNAQNKAEAGNDPMGVGVKEGYGDDVNW